MENIPGIRLRLFYGTRILPYRLQPGFQTMLTDLQGQIERITYANEENGYTIAKVKVYGRRDLVTVVGNFMTPQNRIMSAFVRICGGEVIITFECKKCHHVFEYDVGSVSLPEGADRPHFEKRPLCPTCGEISIEEVRLTELGQDQLAAAVLGFDDDFGDDFGGVADTPCYGCDRYLPVNDLNLCDECNGKLDRDLVRKRDWDYAASAFGLDPAKREELRRQVIARYGEKFEPHCSFKQNKEFIPKAKKKRQEERGPVTTQQPDVGTTVANKTVLSLRSASWPEGFMPLPLATGFLHGRNLKSLSKCPAQDKEIKAKYS